MTCVGLLIKYTQSIEKLNNLSLSNWNFVRNREKTWSCYTPLSVCHSLLIYFYFQLCNRITQTLYLNYIAGSLNYSLIQWIEMRPVNLIFKKTVKVALMQPIYLENTKGCLYQHDNYVYFKIKLQYGPNSQYQYHFVINY